MKAIFNHKTIHINSFYVNEKDRAFQYGDGMFETMLAVSGTVRLMNYHWKRIIRGTDMLQLKLPDNFTEEYLNKTLRSLLSGNRLLKKARIKLMIWRKAGGRYEPAGNDTNFLITTESYENKPLASVDKVGFCNTIRNEYSLWSSFKTCSSLPYVLASLEKKQRQLDDLILLDSNGNISELLYSNIFWIRENNYYTPAMKTGCVGGVMRSYLIDYFRVRGLQIEEVMADREDLFNADHVFASNAMGLFTISSIDNTRFKPFPDLSDLLP